MDDEPAAVTAVSRWLEMLGYRVFAATTVAEALAITYLFKADVVIADWYVGDATGEELLEAIASVSPECRRVVLSSHTRDEAGYSGDLVDMWLRKPVGFDMLRAAVPDESAA